MIPERETGVALGFKDPHLTAFSFTASEGNQFHHPQARLSVLSKHSPREESCWSAAWQCIMLSFFRTDHPENTEHKDLNIMLVTG